MDRPAIIRLLRRSRPESLGPFPERQKARCRRAKPALSASPTGDTYWRNHRSSQMSKTGHIDGGNPGFAADAKVRPALAHSAGTIFSSLVAPDKTKIKFRGGDPLDVRTGAAFSNRRPARPAPTSIPTSATFNVLCVQVEGRIIAAPSPAGAPSGRGRASLACGEPSPLPRILIH